MKCDVVPFKMSTVMFACRVFGQEISNFVSSTISVFSQVPRRYKYELVKKPKPGVGKAFRRIVHFEDRYTVKPLNVTNLGGRDPVTGERYYCYSILYFFLALRLM